MFSAPKHHEAMYARTHRHLVCFREFWGQRKAATTESSRNMLRLANDFYGSNLRLSEFTMNPHPSLWSDEHEKAHQCHPVEISAEDLKQVKIHGWGFAVLSHNAYLEFLYANEHCKTLVQTGEDVRGWYANSGFVREEWLRDAKWALRNYRKARNLLVLLVSRDLRIGAIQKDLPVLSASNDSDYPCFSGLDAEFSWSMMWNYWIIEHLTKEDKRSEINTYKRYNGLVEAVDTVEQTSIPFERNADVLFNSKTFHLYEETINDRDMLVSIEALLHFVWLINTIMIFISNPSRYLVSCLQQISDRKSRPTFPVSISIIFFLSGLFVSNMVSGLVQQSALCIITP